MVAKKLQKHAKQDLQKYKTEATAPAHTHIHTRFPSVQLDWQKKKTNQSTCNVCLQNIYITGKAIECTKKNMHWPFAIPTMGITMADHQKQEKFHKTVPVTIPNFQSSNYVSREAYTLLPVRRN